MFMNQNWLYENETKKKKKLLFLSMRKLDKGKVDDDIFSVFALFAYTFFILTKR